MWLMDNLKLGTWRIVYHYWEIEHHTLIEMSSIFIERDGNYFFIYDETEKIPQRNFLQEKGYVLVKQCEWIEDFWINPKYISENKYEILKQVNSRDGEEVHPWDHLKNKGYDWTHFYKE